MGLPKIEIIFKSLAASAIKRGERGTVALVLQDTIPLENPIVMYGVNEIPENLTNANKEQILLAFKGGVNPPRKVVAYIVAQGTEMDPVDYTEAMTYLETVLWDYLAVPGISDLDGDMIATWVKGLRDNKDMGVKAVLPNCDADHEGVINFATDDIKAGDRTYTAAEYCARIAGMAAGCPLTMSLTYQVLPEVDDVPHLTTEEFDAAIDAGKLVLMHDGEKVKIARGVNSLTTVTADKGEDWKKILIVDKMDLWKDDVKRTIADSYLGKRPNTYDNKMLLIAAIQAYNDEWELEGLLDGSSPDYNRVGIDLERQTAFLKGLGEPVDDMDEQEIKMANTKDKVFIATNLKFVDAMEDFVVSVDM
jgi:hypothetical protein